MRTRRNGSVIGRRNSYKNYKRSGVWNSDDVFHAKADAPRMLDTYQKRLPENQWYPKAGAADPHYDQVVFHFGDCEYTNGMMRDQSGNGGEMYLQTVDYQSHPINTWFGPRYRDWCTKFHEGDYYNITDAANLRFGTGTFIIEFWYKGLRQDATQHYIMGKGANAGVTAGTGWVIGINTSYQAFWFDAQQNVTITSSIAMNRDTWYHLAFVRNNTSGNGFVIMVNGTNRGQGQSTGNFTDTNPLRIGVDRVVTGGTWFGGKITDIRICTNVTDNAGSVGRSTNGYSTPTTPTDMTVASCVFSLSMLRPHHDNLPTAQLQGQTSVRNGYMFRTIDSPFLNNTTKLTGHGSASLFSYENACWYRQYDTNPTRSFQFGTGAFTVECWIYCTYNNPNIAIAGKGTGNSTSGSGWSFWIDGSGYLRWDSDSTAINSSPNNPITPGGWYHVAAVRVNTLPNQFGMFVNGLPTYTGTLTANYTQTDWLAVFASRNAQYVSNGYIAGFRISGVARYTPGNTFNTTVEPSNGSVAFIDTSMATDANTWVLYGTTGTDEPGPAYEHYADQGTIRYLAPRRTSNELRYGSVHPYSRVGYSWKAWRDSAWAMLAMTDVGTNFTFGTGDFSIESWLRWDESENWYGTNYWRVITCWKTSFNDSHFRIRLNNIGFIEVEYAGRPLINDSYTNLGISMRTWTHWCLQRTNGKLALYVQGKKAGEIVFTDNLAAPTADGVSGGINWLNDSYSNLAYNNKFSGAITDIRILKGSSAYGINNTRNPDYIKVPVSYLTAITNTVCLVSARYPFPADTATGTPNLVEMGGRSRGGFTSGKWDVYAQNASPYTGVTPWSRDRQCYLGNWDAEADWYSPGPQADNTNTYEDHSYITRMSGAWTIEIWHMLTTQDPGSDANRYRSLYTADSGGQEGWTITDHQNSGAGYEWSNMCFTFWTAHNSGAQRIAAGSWPGNRMRIHAPNHIAIQYDPAAGSKMAMFVNGFRINTAAAFSPGQKTWNTYSLRADGYGNGTVRISRVARYNNDATTYTVPEGFWTYDANTMTLMTIYPPIPDKALVNNHFWYGRGGMPVYKYKKFGNASLGFNNYDTSTQSDYISLDYGGTWNVWNTDFRRADFTVECWAIRFDTAAGSRAINASVGNVLWHYANNICMQVNTTGYWRFRIANAAGTGLTSNNTQGYNDVNPGTWLSCTTTNNVFDHVAVVRRAGNFHLYINGVELGICPGTNLGTFPTGGPTSENSDLDYTSNAFTLGAGYGTQAVTGWTGCIQDFRVSYIARYETRAIVWGAKSYAITGSSVCTITTTTDNSTMCPSQPITFNTSFGGITGGSTYYIRTIETNGFSVSTSVGGSPVTVGTTSALSVTGTTQQAIISTMVYPESNQYALPRALFPTY